LPFLHQSYLKGLTFRPLSKLFFWFFIADFLLLTWIGGQPVEDPYILVGQMASIFYFSYFLLLFPFISNLENKLLQLN
jgi:ubiquinol-cytochrome c reductase cytochrome b subunit